MWSDTAMTMTVMTSGRCIMHRPFAMPREGWGSRPRSMWSKCQATAHEKTSPCGPCRVNRMLPRDGTGLSPANAKLGERRSEVRLVAAGKRRKTAWRAPGGREPRLGSLRPGPRARPGISRPGFVCASGSRPGLMLDSCVCDNVCSRPSMWARCSESIALGAMASLRFR
jgi:hypothetical protein